MMSQRGIPAAVCVELSLFEARQVQRFLDGLIAQADTVSNVTVLAAARDRVSDASALALWLRENVTLDLPPDDAQTVLEVLSAEAVPPSTPQDAAAALAAARSKLRQCLSQCVVWEG